MDDWWDFIYPGYGWVEFRIIDREGGVRQIWTRYPNDPMIVGVGEDVYYGVIPRSNDTGGTATDCWPTTEVLWADVDVKDFGGRRDAALDSILQFRVSPSAIVDSGHGFHCYWKLTSPFVFHKARRIMEGIAQRIGGDAVYDQARILRVPSTLNWKDPEHPAPVRLLKLDTLRRYQESDFNEILPPVTGTKNIWVERREDAPDWLRDIINEEPPKGARSEAEFKAGIWLARLGYGDEEILSTLMNSPVGVKAQQRGERWAEQEVKRIRSKA